MATKNYDGGKGTGKSPTRRKKTVTTPKVKRAASAKSRKRTRVVNQEPSLVESRVSTSEALHAEIAKRAYELYERRGWSHGRDFSDWLEAEQEILKEKSLAKY